MTPTGDEGPKWWYTALEKRIERIEADQRASDKRIDGLKSWAIALLAALLLNLLYSVLPRLAGFVK